MRENAVLINKVIVTVKGYGMRPESNLFTINYSSYTCMTKAESISHTITIHKYQIYTDTRTKAVS